MLPLIFTVVGLALFAIAAHPFTTYPLSLSLFSRRAGRVQLPLAVKPSVAICMSAFNEEQVIVAKVESLIAMAARYGPATIHIYVDGALDRTAELLTPYADRVDLVLSTARLGKTAGLNVLVDRSSSELLLFTDANVINEVDALDLLAGALADPMVGCATARLVYTNPGESSTSRIGAQYWAVEERVKELESRTVGVIGVDGAMFALRRALHRPAPPMLIDDLYVTLSVLVQGYQVVRVKDVVVRERNAVKVREEFRRKARIACQAMNVHKALWPKLRRLPPRLLYGYVSHRLIKWMVPFLITGALLSLFIAFAAVAPIGITLALVLLAAGVLALGAFSRFGPANHIWAIVMNLAGVGYGVLQSLFTKQTYSVWTPAASIRDETESVGKSG